VSWADLPTSGLLCGDVVAPRHRRSTLYRKPAAINERYADAVPIDGAPGSGAGPGYPATLNSRRNLVNAYRADSRLGARGVIAEHATSAMAGRGAGRGWGRGAAQCRSPGAATMAGVNVRRLAAVDMYGAAGTLRRRRIILAEFAAGAVGLVALGCWLAAASADLGGRALGIWMTGAGFNYAPLAAARPHCPRCSSPT
jgi:hypothetical protein